MGIVGDHMRVVHLTTISSSLEYLLKTELLYQQAAGCKVVGMSAPGPSAKRLEGLGIQHVAIRGLSRRWSPSGDFRALTSLVRELRRIRPDVLHTHTPKAGVLGRFAGRLARVPVVGNTCHGLWAPPNGGRAGYLLALVAEGVAAQLSDFELYQNEEDFRRMAPLVRRARRAVVGNGVDLDLFKFSPHGREEVRAELGIAADEVCVGSVGRQVAEKGLLEFASTAGMLSGKARFLWIGAPDLEKWDAVTSQLPNLMYLGHRDDMPSVYSALDVFVLASYREGLSRSAMEAAACGRALVLSNIRGCREIGEHGKEVLLVPPKDVLALSEAVGRLVVDRDYCARLGAAARARAERAFDQKAVAQLSLAAYRDSAVARLGQPT